MKSNINVLSKEGKEQYSKKNFTEFGEKLLNNYLKALVKLHFIKKDDEYPFSIGIVFGLPMFDWAQSFRNKEILLERIKTIALILGIDTIEVDVGDAKLTMELRKDGN